MRGTKWTRTRPTKHDSYSWTYVVDTDPPGAPRKVRMNSP